MTVAKARWADRPYPTVSVRWLAAVALCTALGLASIAVADAGGREGDDSTYVFFWVGMLLLFVPVALASLRERADRRERLLLVVVLGVALYLVKVLYSPDAFAFFDEFIHWRNTEDILRTGRLFEFNPLLATAAYYPGLASVAAGLTQLSGLSVFTSGLVVMLAARVLISVSLFLVAEKVTGSSRVAAAASLIYAANPMFLFVGAHFSYEGLALPLAAFVVWWIGRTRATPHVGTEAVSLLVIAAVVVTHHVVGFALTALLGSWWVAERIAHRGLRQPGSHRKARRSLGVMTVVTGLATMAWFFLVAQPAASYLLGGNVIPALQQTVSLVMGEIEPRGLYASGGYVAPLWERAAGFASVGFLLLALPVALVRAWGRREYAPIMIAMGVAVLYPLSLAPRLAPIGAAVSGRASEYVFTGLACIVGLLSVESVWWRPSSRPGGRRHIRLRGWTRTMLDVGFASVVFVGGVTIGSAFYQRLPESSSPEGYPWSVQADVIRASEWARSNLGIHQSFGATDIDALALATYGEQNPVSGEDTWPIFFNETMSDAVVDTIRKTGVRYLLIDWRTTRGVPATPGFYFSQYEPHAGTESQSFPEASLRKFGSDPCVELVYDTEFIDIVDLSAILSGTCELEEPGGP